MYDLAVTTDHPVVRGRTGNPGWERSLCEPLLKSMLLARGAWGIQMDDSRRACSLFPKRWNKSGFTGPS